jgi:hypothetical protein
MAINPLLIGSITSIALVNGANLPPGRHFPTLSEQSRWSDVLGFADYANCPARPARADSAIPRKPAWAAQLDANAESLATLHPGWDGPGSISMSASTLSRAVFYVTSAVDNQIDVKPPRLVPAGDGSIQIEWHTKRGELEFDIDDRGEMSIWIRNHLIGAEFDGEGAEALALFYRWAPWIAARPNDAANVPVAPQMADLSFAA